MNFKNIIGTFFMGLFLLVAANVSAQQEHQYTQFMYNQLLLNPAYAGATGGASVMALYRNQWLGFEGSPESKLISFHTPFAGNRAGVGLAVSNHTAGITSAWYASMSYAYNLAITDETGIRVGLQGSMRYYGYDFADPAVIIRDNDDPSLSTDQEDQFTGNFGLGLYFTHKQFYIGVSSPHLFPNEITLNRVSSVTRIAKEVPHIYLIAGGAFPLNDKVDLKPAALFKYVKNAPADLDLNLSLTYNKTFTGGVSYRFGGEGSGDSVDLLAMYQYKNIGIGLAYDFTLSQINDHSNGSLEVMLRYDFAKEEDDMANPRFFF